MKVPTARTSIRIKKERIRVAVGYHGQQVGEQVEHEKLHLHQLQVLLFLYAQVWSAIVPLVTFQTH